MIDWIDLRAEEPSLFPCCLHAQSLDTDSAGLSRSDLDLELYEIYLNIQSAPSVVVSTSSYPLLTLVRFFGIEKPRLQLSDFAV